MADKIKVSVVSYLNSKPFAFGLLKSDILKNIELSFDIPSTCAAKLETGLVDIGLVPVAVLVDNDNLHTVGNFCISADRKVRTVVLASEVPVQETETVLMDYQSRSSVLLTQVLAKSYWKKKFRYENTSSGFEHQLINGKTAGVVIGDRVFDIEKKYPYIYDLSEEWLKFTGLPFVFAVWAANRNLDDLFLSEFESALNLGVENIARVIEEEKNFYPGVDLFEYFTDNIKFRLDTKKQEAIARFIELAKNLNRPGSY